MPVEGQGAAPLPGWAAGLAASLYGESHTDRPADQVIVNEYLPGQGISGGSGYIVAQQLLRQGD